MQMLGISLGSSGRTATAVRGLFICLSTEFRCVTSLAVLEPTLDKVVL